MMSDNENSMPPNESDEDIYKDISDFNFENVLAKLEGTNEAHRQEASDLAEKVKKLTVENEELRKLNETLGKNLSSLLKTAQNEVKRKDSVIEELRVQVDSLVLRKSNKKTKDKSTSTEDLKWAFDFKNVTKECKSEGNSCTNSSKSFEEKTSFNENKFNNKKKVNDNKDEHIFCDSGKNYKNSMPRVRDKDWGFRDGRRDSTKYDYFDRERFSSRSYDNHKWPQSRSYRSERDHHRKQSPRRKRHSQRNRNLSFSRSRSRSRSPQRSRSSKESSIERQRISRSPYNRNEKTKSRSSSRNKITNSECQKNYLKTLDDKDKAEKSKEKIIKISEKNQIKEKKTSIKSENKNIDFHYQKSPLDAIYDVNEEITSSRRLISNAEKSKLNFGEKVQETEEPQSHSKPEVQEDWTLSFKNERQNKSNPMTVYTRRMLQKLNSNSVTETKVGQAIKNSNTCKETENFEKENSKEKLQIDSEPVETEKEPGELTEDENEVESSKEFQKMTKIAFERNTLLEKSDLQNQEGPRDKGDLCRKVIDKKFDDKKRVELSSVKTNKNIEEIPEGEILCFQKDINSPKKVREVIEFSPFKNNYKLIEISPLKQLETSKNKRLTPNLFTQNTVESSTFKFLSALSGIPLYKESKPKTEQNNQEELNKMLNSSNLTSKEIKSSCVNMNELNILDEKSASENCCKSKISKNQSAPEIQEKKITKCSPKKRFETEKREESMKSQITKDSNFEKAKTKNTDKDNQSTNLIENKILPETFSSYNEKDLKFDKRHDHDIIEQKDLILKKVSEENLKFSTYEKGNNFVPKHKPSNTRDEEIMSSTSKEYPEGTKTLNSSEVSDGFLNDSVEFKKTNVLKSCKSETSKSQQNSKTFKSKENSEKKMRRKLALKNEHKKDTNEEKNVKKKRKLSEKPKTEGNNESQDEPMVKRLRSHKDMKNEEGNSNENEKVKEDISFFEFFKPIDKSTKARKTEAEETSNSGDFKMTAMSVTNVVCLETPNKGVEKFKNFMINEQTIYHVLDTKSNFSPHIGANCIEMTPRRLLKNDLMLTDSEDDSVVKIDQKPKLQEETKEKKEDEHDDDENDEISESDNCEWESDSGASDFVDLL